MKTSAVLPPEVGTRPPSMQHMRNNVQVGIPGMTGLSVEQRKRVTIAVELVANPSIVFMDEPTSGRSHSNCLQAH